MSKSKNSRRRVISQSPNANRRLPTASPSRAWSLSDYDLTAVEDRRQYHPDGPVRSPRSLSVTYPGIVAPSRPRNDPWAATPLGAMAFDAPRDVLVCVRRKQRKEVLHALKKTGKAGQKRPRRNYYSDIHC